MPTNLVTDTRLLSRLSAAVKRGVSNEERRSQRVSFVYGNLPRSMGMTKNQVERALHELDKADGRD